MLNGVEWRLFLTHFELVFVGSNSTDSKLCKV